MLDTIGIVMDGIVARAARPTRERVYGKKTIRRHVEGRENLMDIEIETLFGSYWAELEWTCEPFRDEECAILVYFMDRNRHGSREFTQELARGISPERPAIAIKGYTDEDEVIAAASELLKRMIADDIQEFKAALEQAERLPAEAAGMVEYYTYEAACKDAVRRFQHV